MNIQKSRCIMLLVLVLLGTKNINAQQKPRLNHLAIYVTNLETSARFYGELIGLDSIPEPFHDGKHAWFNLGGIGQLHVISGAERPIEKNKNNHLCFSVPSIEAYIFKLNERKIPFENWLGEKGQITLRPDGKKQIWFQDPDGYWIEINNDYQP